ncbi:hypothetical protein B5K05_02160 [Rhizobium phaseoli]|nr:hypothetical protein RPHASCH2410_CH06785 [Rhizobium phaseoli Ch24-10]RDJ18597.1 hypothetical protein B5K04_02155 [Rhizobium phaseoli]RDJ19256.1 hypothetical protein B5K05_02160 [Rhizobium phaseoli]
MKEVRSVLHAIFRCLLKTLDDGELRRRGCLGQGKTCRLIHISNFAGRFCPALWRMGTKSVCRTQVHKLSTGRRKSPVEQGFGIVSGFVFFRKSQRNRKILFEFGCGRATNGIGSGWILILDRHRL